MIKNAAKLLQYLTPALWLALGVAYAEDNYSLDLEAGAPSSNSSRAQNAPMDEGAVLNFDAEEPQSLFGDEVIPNNEVPMSSARTGGMSKGFEDDPAAQPEPTANHAAPRDVSAVIEPAPVQTSPATTLLNGAPSNAAATPLPPPQAPALPPPNTVDATSSTSTAAPVIAAPLATAAGPAPIKELSPLQPNEFSGVPPMPGSRKNLARGQAPETYLVEAGDNLYDVCSQLIDDGNYWPRLWSLNPDIKNPHFVYPGMKLAFYSGDALNPPYMEVVEEDDMVPLDKGSVTEAELVAQQSEIPSTSADLTPSKDLIEFVTQDQASPNVSFDGFEFGGGAYTGDDIIVTLPGVVLSEEIEPIGVIAAGLRGEMLAGEGVRVRIDDSAGLSPGTTYSVLRPTGEVQDQNTGDDVGYRYEFVGNVRVARKLSEETCEGVAQNVRLGLRVGDVIVNFLSTKRVVSGFSGVGPVSSVDASIIGFEHAAQRFAAHGGLVFLNKGGLPVGGFYPVIQKNIYSMRPGSGLSTDGAGERQVGVVRVIDSGQQSSVAIVVQTSSEIRIGDTLTSH